jgi:hypothetical protein
VTHVMRFADHTVSIQRRRNIVAEVRIVEKVCDDVFTWLDTIVGIARVLGYQRRKFVAEITVLHSINRQFTMLILFILS